MTNEDPNSREVSRRAEEGNAQQFSQSELPLRFIKAEANLLRLPLFALHTKGLRTLDGLECTGITTRGGQTHEFRFRVTRNTSSLYPGPLSRRFHFAVLGIATEQGLPLANPLSWGWRDLCRRMDIAYAGSSTIRDLKAAVRSTHGIVIHTQSALFSRNDGLLLPSHERGHHLYSDYVFVNDEMPDGSRAETNHVWLADWYLANLNSLFTAPLDYQLWIKLEKKSPIASRLYEFLLINFYSGTPVLRINYPNLAQFLPVQAHRYVSLAERQLKPAFELLITVDVLKEVQWGTSRDGIPQLFLYRGDRLTAPRDRMQPVLGFMEEEFSSSMAVRELRNIKPPEWGIVAEFYRFWEDNEDHRPSKKELEQARGYLDRFGPRKAKDVVGRAMKDMKKGWPQAKTFAALERYIPAAVLAFDQKQKDDARQKAERKKDETEQADFDRRQAAERALVEKWLPIWESLTPVARAAIEAAVIEKNPYLKHKLFNRDSSFRTHLFLEELASRHAAPPATDVADGPQTA